MSIRVFLADDHAIIRDGLAFILRAEPDLEVVGSATNGRDAVAQIQELRPDVVVMDISMPELNGIDAAAQLHTLVPATRVIILSMHSSREHVVRALTAGASGYLLKESAGTEVVQAVRAVHRGERYLCSRVRDVMIDIVLSPSASDNPLAVLSAREREVMQLVVEGKPSRVIAQSLALSEKTIETYRSRIMQKLDVKNITELVRFAIQHGLVDR